MGVPHVQFNIVDRHTILGAQKHPEKHQNLIVSVVAVQWHPELIDDRPEHASLFENLVRTAQAGL